MVGNYNVVVFDSEGNIKAEESVSALANKAVKSNYYKDIHRKRKENKIINRELGGRVSVIDSKLLELVFKLKPYEFKLFIVLLSNLELGNNCYLTQTALASIMKSERSNISAGLKKLKEVGAIEIFKEKGIVHRMYYRVSPLIAYKGKYEDWKKEIFENNEALLTETEMNDYYGE